MLPVAHLEIWRGGGAQWYMSGVDFQKCLKFSIFFTLNINTEIVLTSKGEAQAQGP